LRERIS